MKTKISIKKIAAGISTLARMGAGKMDYLAEIYKEYEKSIPSLKIILDNTVLLETPVICVWTPLSGRIMYRKIGIPFTCKIKKEPPETQPFVVLKLSDIKFCISEKLAVLEAMSEEKDLALLQVALAKALKKRTGLYVAFVDDENEETPLHMWRR